MVDFFGFAALGRPPALLIPSRISFLLKGRSSSAYMVVFMVKNGVIGGRYPRQEQKELYSGSISASHLNHRHYHFMVGLKTIQPYEK